ncbi:hypothetical protein EMPG_17833 [Blastomyces silverae]|uniref:Uncharacterized protein n=1 Tax=Blastomyces silverae TaxID=2060906 RepID=A0A0H1B6R2_9EURO|nr:hypothetical protein EMPG_17833 [Blastomyces silverae]
MSTSSSKSSPARSSSPTSTDAAFALYSPRMTPCCQKMASWRKRIGRTCAFCSSLEASRCRVIRSLKNSRRFCCEWALSSSMTTRRGKEEELTKSPLGIQKSTMRRPRKSMLSNGNRIGTQPLEDGAPGERRSIQCTMLPMKLHKGASIDLAPDLRCRGWSSGQEFYPRPPAAARIPCLSHLRPPIWIREAG